MSVGALAVLQVDGGRVGIQIGLVVLGVESQKHVADDDRSKYSPTGAMNPGANCPHLHEAVNVSLDLLRGDFLVNRKAVAAADPTARAAKPLL